MSATAVVILNFNGENLLGQFLPSVVRCSGSAEIFVVDNGSTDSSLEILRRDFPSVLVIPFSENHGFCGGYNRALRQIQARYYVLLNSDVEVTDGWLNPLIALMDENPRIGAVQPKILSFRDRHFFEYAGAAGGFIDSLGYPFCRGRVFETIEEDFGQYNDTVPIFWATGACLMIRSDKFHQFGGLDEDFFAHMEEIDLCWKLQRSGSTIWYCGESTVYHLGAGTLGYARPRKTYLNFRNGLSLIYKHLDPMELVYKLPLRMLLDWVAAALFLMKGQFAHGSAVIKAHIDFARHWRENSLKRSKLRSTFPSYSREAVLRGSIIWNYFLRGRKTFKGNSSSPR